MRWDLTPLFDSFESEAFAGDMKRLGTLIEGIEKWIQSVDRNSNAGEVIEQFLRYTMQSEDLIELLYRFIHLSIAVDSSNETAKKYSDILKTKMNRLILPEVKFKKWLRDIDIENIRDFALIDEHRYFLEEMKDEAQHTLSDREEDIISQMRMTGSNAWSMLQNSTVSEAAIDLNGREVTITDLKNDYYSTDSNTRKQAYEKEMELYPRIAKYSAFALNAIKGEVLTLSKRRGYESPLHMTLKHSRMREDTLNAMLTAIEHTLPDFEHYYRKKGELLGHKNGLPFYDIFAPMGDADMTFTYDEAASFIKKHFASFSDELAQFADNAFKKRWIDAEPRKGKRGGAFCAGIHSKRQCRVLANFNGTFSGITTLAHELGHGFHGYCLYDESSINSNYPMPIAETASIFCESIIVNAVLRDADPELKKTILENQISDAGQVIVDIFSRFTFEETFFERRAHAPLSVDEITTMFTDAQKRAYRKGLDNNCLHPYRWIDKPHYYYAGLNYYNFPYAFGMLFAKGLYARYLKEGRSFVPHYMDILRNSGKNSIEDITQLAGIDITKPDFWYDSLSLVKNEIDEFMKI